MLFLKGSILCPDDSHHRATVQWAQAPHHQLPLLQSRHIQQDMAAAAHLHREHGFRAGGNEAAQSSYVYGPETLQYTNDFNRLVDWCTNYFDWLVYRYNNDINSLVDRYTNRVTSVAVAAPFTKRDLIVKLHYITCGARNGMVTNFEVSLMHAYCIFGFISNLVYVLTSPE